MPTPRTPMPSSSRSPVLRKRDLTPARRRFIERMQQTGFGRYEHVVVRRGEPQLDPAPRCTTEVKFGADDNGPRPEAQLADYTLKPQVVEFLDLCSRLGDAEISLLEIRHGVPYRVSLVEDRPKPPQSQV
jgi:hypothetical protein